MFISKKCLIVLGLWLMAFNAVSAPLSLHWPNLIPPEYREDTMALIKSTMNPYIHKDGEIAPQRSNDQLKMTVPEYDGKDVTIEGYMVPLETNVDGITTLLLAPYAGACVHVPPPPPNQLVYIELAEDQVIPWDFYMQPITIQGKMTIEQFQEELMDDQVALSGYTIKSANFDVQ